MEPVCAAQGKGQQKGQADEAEQRVCSQRTSIPEEAEWDGPRHRCMLASDRELEPRSASRQSCFISPHTKLGFVFLLKYFKGLIFHPQVFYYVSPQRKLFIPDSHNTIVTPNKINYNSSIHLKPSLFSHFPLSQMSFCSWFKSRLRLRVVDASQVSCDL